MELRGAHSLLRLHHLKSQGRRGTGVHMVTEMAVLCSHLASLLKWDLSLLSALNV